MSAEVSGEFMEPECLITVWIKRLISTIALEFQQEVRMSAPIFQNNGEEIISFIWIILSAENI